MDSPEVNWIWNNNWSLTASFAFTQSAKMPQFFFQVTPAHTLIVTQHCNGIDCFFANITVLVWWLWYLKMWWSFVTQFCDREGHNVVLSLCLFPLGSHGFGNPFFLPHFRCTNSLCTVFSILAEQDELYKLATRTVWPCFSRKYINFTTVADVLLVLVVIVRELRFASLHAYTWKDHKYTTREIQFQILMLWEGGAVWKTDDLFRAQKACHDTRIWRHCSKRNWN